MSRTIIVVTAAAMLTHSVFSERTTAFIGSGVCTDAAGNLFDSATFYTVTLQECTNYCTKEPLCIGFDYNGANLQCNLRFSDNTIPAGVYADTSTSNTEGIEPIAGISSVADYECIAMTSTPTEAPTTGAPTMSPTTGAPTLSPTTNAPSMSPVTAAPSTSPTLIPTGSPTTEWEGDEAACAAFTIRRDCDKEVNCRWRSKKCTTTSTRSPTSFPTKAPTYTGFHADEEKFCNPLSARDCRPEPRCKWLNRGRNSICTSVYAAPPSPTANPTARPTTSPTTENSWCGNFKNANVCNGRSERKCGWDYDEKECIPVADCNSSGNSINLFPTTKWLRVMCGYVNSIADCDGNTEGFCKWDGAIVKCVPSDI